MAPVIIDNEAKLKVLLSHIKDLLRERNDQLLFIDIEGVNLSRLGTLAIVQLLMPPFPITFLVDVHVLGARTFETKICDDMSLKHILESRHIFKVFFDVRNDSDALHALFGINVAGVIDLQVVEYVVRSPRGRFVHGLAKCIEQDLPYIPGWSLVKANGRRLFAPEAGGKYEIFLERPIATDIVKYCEQDVMLMPQLLTCYSSRLHPGVAAQLQAIVDERIRLSKTETFNGKGRHMALGPIIADGYKHANKSVSLEVDVISSARINDLCHLDNKRVDDLINQFDALRAKQEQPAISDGATTTSSSATQASESCEAVRALELRLANLTANVIDEDRSDERDDGEDLSWRRAVSYRDREEVYDRDYTACSADDCGYCGKCEY